MELCALLERRASAIRVLVIFASSPAPPVAGTCATLQAEGSGAACREGAEHSSCESGGTERESGPSCCATRPDSACCVPTSPFDALQDRSAG